MYMQRLLIFSLSLLFLAQVPSVSGQGNRRAKKETQASVKDQVERKAEREAAFDKQMTERQERHVQAQTKDTQKRMKKNRKRSERINRRTHVPFYKRWFRKRHFK